MSSLPSLLPTSHFERVFPEIGYAVAMSVVVAAVARQHCLYYSTNLYKREKELEKKVKEILETERKEIKKLEETIQNREAEKQEPSVNVQNKGQEEQGKKKNSKPGNQNYQK